MTMQKPGLRSLLLSPPVSPRMASYRADSATTDWQQRRIWQQVPGQDLLTPLDKTPSSDQKTFSSGPLSADDPEGSETKPRQTSLVGKEKNSEQHRTTQNRDDIFQRPQTTRADPPLTLATSNNRNVSAAQQLTTPTSPVNDEKEGFDDDSVSMEGDDEDDIAGVGDGKSAAERRMDKRKMKRFRLTHNQTRFLMSEFTRQAHPDAAHRERLSREIPGLSPRQVQVWFQNRRAKMKRLTMDDQERVLRSRALPEDFDMAQTLHSPFDGQGIPGGALTSPGSYVPSYGETSFGRPFIANDLRGQSDDGMTSSSFSIQSAYGNSIFTPLTSDNVSPISTTSDRHFPTPSHHHHQASPRSVQFYGSSGSVPGYSSPQIPRLQHSNTFGQARPEALQSPLRSSVSYSSQPIGVGETRSLSAGISLGPRTDAYGVNHRFGQHGAHPYEATTSITRPRPIPAGLQLKSEYHGSPASTGVLRMQSAPLAPPPEYHSPQLSAPYYSTSFGNTNAAMPNEPATLPLPSKNGIYHGGSGSPHQQSYSQASTPGFANHHGGAHLPASIPLGEPRRSFPYGPGAASQ